MTGTCKAVCQIANSSNNNVLGYLTLTQTDGPTCKITGSLSGLTPGKHGISVCVAGDLSDGAASCGSIFNPFDKRHGDPADKECMAGDLGNIVADESGTAEVELTETNVQLLGPHSVIGRSIVIYAGEDDRGRGGHENSQQTGNPGPRIAAGVVGICL
uniref:Superoxide dismutase copper/zinc binding domain-containing protein n=1 Tax=Amphora coffeiformis TaxID=265554 RepID=A0A7S3PCU6_9STRA|mmetsp:Transcript_767/g.1451  ORF Transcript_767/g.1451 Transcript_767/m.1451 type:complete len:158 (+) Transcript_767:78-551(+)